ncbi:MAG: response regulator [Candidatus Nanopelagicales bacterium]|nr:response regulator [Candidatus Nanopelagicales bacterium]
MSESDTHDETGSVSGLRRVVLVEDEDFTRTAVTGVLQGGGFAVVAVGTVSSAIEAIEVTDPHAVVSDLDLGPGPTGADLLRRVADERPWVGLVALTAHRSIQLAVEGSARLPEGAIMIVKSRLESMEDITTAVEDSIAQVTMGSGDDGAEMGDIVVTALQAEILRLMAEGLSNAGIAARRGTSLRAAEASVQRTLQALGLTADPDFNSRVLAVRLWQSGQVAVR